MACSSSSPCSNNTHKMRYDVFLSFRGEDTRNTFTSHLYSALCRRKIETFIDYELRKGDEISPALSKTIEDSSISIVILSKNYASSTWCLNELLKILDCKETKGQIVLPVFYHVLPSDVRKQSGSYKEAFAKHEKCFRKTKDKVSSWRDALTQIASLSGWDIKQHDGLESEFIENIIRAVLKTLNRISTYDSLNGLVGIVSHIKKVDSLLCIETTDFRIMGIWGMAGVGKTTLARTMFNRIANHFESSCFLANIREEYDKFGPNYLQKKLLSEILDEQKLELDAFTIKRLYRKKVLIVLDDVNKTQHLEYLIGDHSWYSLGSRIIVTSRNKQVLKNGVDELYELKELDYCNALKLFSLNAFKQSYPRDDYMALSNQVVDYTKGNPLALKVLGCFLQGRSKQEWKSSLNKLKKCPNLEIQNMLRISYDGLDDQEKEIFLDIACCFKGEDKDHVIAILDAYGLSAEIGISVLVDKCLIIVIENKLLMHDLIQDMGHSIVLQESIKEPEKRTRLWDPQDISNIFKKNRGTLAVESISLDLSQINELHLNSDAFVSMCRLKFLKFYSSNYNKNKKENDKVHLHQGLELLPDELRYLHWHRYPLGYLPPKFNPENLVELQMHHSNVEHLWKEDKHLEKLRRIDLSHSQNLTEGPNLSGSSNLQIMVLNGCSRLTEFPKISWNVKKLHLDQTAIEQVPSAIESLHQLVTLSLNGCRRLKNLPCNIRNLTSLWQLSLKGCTSITEFPEISGGVVILYLDETAVEEVPSSIEHLTELNWLSLTKCRKLKRVSSGIFKLEHLVHVFLSGCSKLDDLPQMCETETKGNLRCLYLDRTAIKELPAAIALLPRLHYLSIEYCKNIASLPNNICNLNSLATLNLSGCHGVAKLLEDLPVSSSSGLSSLKYLQISECNLLTLPSALARLSSVVVLDLSGNNFETLNLKPFSCLEDLNISHCKKLQSLEEFPVPSRLKCLRAHQCISLETLPTSNVVFTGNCNAQQSFIYFNCLKLDSNARISIMADARLRIQVMATKACGTLLIEDYVKGFAKGVSFGFCFPGKEIPEWFSHQNKGSFLILKLPSHWRSTTFLGFALCIVAEFQDCEYLDFSVNYKCYFTTVDCEVYDVVCNLRSKRTHEKLGFLESDHVFLLYAHRLSAAIQIEDGEDNFRMYSSCCEARFEFSPVDVHGQPLPNCKIKKCGVQLLYSQEEDIQKSGDDSLNEQGLGGVSISNVEDKADPNPKTWNETEHNLESQVDTLLLPEGGVKMMFEKAFLSGLALFNCLFSCGGV